MKKMLLIALTVIVAVVSVVAVKAIASTVPTRVTVERVIATPAAQPDADQTDNRPPSSEDELYRRCMDYSGDQFPPEQYPSECQKVYDQVETEQQQQEQSDDWPPANSDELRRRCMDYSGDQFPPEQYPSECQPIYDELSK